MGRLVLVTCRVCGVESTQTDGPGMLGYRPRCEECGHTGFVSIADLIEAVPDKPRPDLHNAAVVAAMTPEELIAAFEPGEDPWDMRERAVPDVAGPCDDCGGRQSLQAPIRCEECRSVAVDTEFAGTFD